MKNLVTATAGILERLGDTVPVSVALLPNMDLPPISVIATGDQLWRGDGDALIEATVAAYGIETEDDLGPDVARCTIQQDGVEAMVLANRQHKETTGRPPRMTSTREHAELLRQIIDWAADLPEAVTKLIIIDTGTEFGAAINLTKQATEADWKALTILTASDDTSRGGQGILPTGHSLTIVQID